MVNLNSILFAILIPVILTYLEVIRTQGLFIPIGVLFLTSLTTLIYSISVLRPFDWPRNSRSRGPDKVVSPFVYYNYLNKDYLDFVDEIDFASKDKNLFKEIVMTDLYLEGRMLGEKYAKLRICYNLYLWGLAAAVTSGIIVILTKF